MHERKYGSEARKEDPRVKFAYDQSAQLFTHLPARVLLGETQSIDLPVSATTHRIWRQGWQMETYVEPLAFELADIGLDADDELNIITLLYSGEEEKSPLFETELILTPLAKSILEERPTLLSDLFSLSQPLPADIKIETAFGRRDFHRITLPDYSFILKYCHVLDAEDGLFQLRAYRHIRSLVERIGHSPQQIAEKVRKAQARPEIPIFRPKLKPAELIAITAPEPIFATRRNIAMTELKGFAERMEAVDLDWRARTILKEKAGFDLFKEFGYHETLYHFDEETGISTVAFIDIHPL